MKFLEIVLENKTRVTDQLYTYSVNEKLENSVEIGKRVIVPFGKGNKKRLGLVVNIQKEFLGNYKLKNISEIIDDKPIVSKELIDLAFFMRDKYLSDLSSAFQTILPPGNWKDLEKVYYFDKYNKFDEKNKELLNFLKFSKNIEEITEKFPKLNTDLSYLVDNNNISTKYIIKNQSKIKSKTFIELRDDFYFDKIKKNAKSQIKIIEYLEKNRKVEQSILLKETSTTSSSIKSLLEKEVILKTEEVYYREVVENNKKYNKIKLNKEQEEVFYNILNSDKNFNLIHGVTGSGKTEIYLQLTEEVLNKGKTAIILVPEISLTPQTIERFSGRFPGKVAVLHSKLLQSEKFEQWQQIKNGDFKIVVGARSAVFAPLDKLGIIIVDEEHETSYISEKNPKYNALEIAEKRVLKNSGKLVLGSATPSIISYNNAISGKYNLYTLENRATNSVLPEVEIVDMREELKKGNISIFSSELKEAVESNLKKGKQSILFLNKRGHTSYIFCRRCGHVEICTHCDVSMTYHKSSNRLICHHCGRTKMKPVVCPNCGSKYIKEFGAGTEKLEEECINLFPKARIYRIDGDTNSNKDSYEKLYEKMKNNEIDILIGTQMITKGFDFKNVTLVGIIAADISLNMGDYRASEKTFQLLTQVSGRAGRGDEKGQVFIQTYKPNHFAIKTSKEHDYKSFYDMEINYREIYKYPPFYKLINIKLSGMNRAQTRLKLFEIQKYIQNEILKSNLKDIELIGPNPSPVNRINNFYRFDINIKIKDENEEIVRIIKEILIDNKYKLDLNGFKLSTTIDPISFF
ncbi:primosomal protein N' [Miniphocaeibacter massiliensis]|uniref:primosomal protein N' n=1 Tax=Miniphocaeibacter massiliensis TaxID=2041841 RepID=UPI000C082341|nr:primosomal protein N' [Miniphocaeibacter massiliensis]